MSACQFVYRKTLGAICRTQNNKDPIFSPPGREPAIQKVAKYGMRDPYMFYKISCPYFIKVHIQYVLLVSRKISRCESWQIQVFIFPLTFISPPRPSAFPFHIVHITCNMYYILHVMCNTYSIWSSLVMEYVCQFVYRGTLSVV